MSETGCNALETEARAEAEVGRAGDAGPAPSPGQRTAVGAPAPSAQPEASWPNLSLPATETIKTFER